MNLKKINEIKWVGSWQNIIRKMYKQNKKNISEHYLGKPFT